MDGISTSPCYLQNRNIIYLKRKSPEQPTYCFYITNSFDSKQYYFRQEAYGCLVVYICYFAVISAILMIIFVILTLPYITLILTALYMSLLQNRAVPITSTHSKCHSVLANFKKCCIWYRGSKLWMSRSMAFCYWR